MKNTVKVMLVLMIAIVVAIGLNGCKGDSTTNNSTTVVNPTDGSIQPLGRVQGYLRDAVTKDPIVGAIIDIGVAQTVTTGDGQYVIENVPTILQSIITDPVANTAGVQTVTTTYAGQYFMTIDMRNVSSPVQMTNPAAAVRYPDFSYDQVRVQIETISNISSGGTNSIAGAPITMTQKVTTKELKVGKLATHITGVVAYAGTVIGERALQPVGPGFTVELLSASAFPFGNAEGSTGGTGSLGNVIQTAVTGSNGDFTFSNVESQQTFSIRAMGKDAAGLDFSNGIGGTGVTALADGETLALTVQKNNAIFVTNTDTQQPIIIANLPENNADVSSAGGQDIVFTFSEPIKQNVYAKTLTQNGVFAAGNGLYQDVLVTNEGAKATPAAHTLSWNATFDKLTITIPVLAPSSRYKVDITNALNNAAKLVDNKGTAVSNAQAVALNAINFTTNTTTLAQQVTGLAIVNKQNLDEGGTHNPRLDWAPASGAKGYNVYRATNEVWQGVLQAGAYELLNAGNPVQQSEYTDALVAPFYVERLQTQLTYSYIVKAINADGTEAAPSLEVVASDTVGPTLMVAPSFTSLLSQSLFGSPLTVNANDTLTLSFNEPLDEASVKAATYVITYGTGTTILAPTVSSVVYSAATNSVILTLSGSVTPSVYLRSIVTGTNGVSNTTADARDTQLVANGFGTLPAATACVTAGTTTALTAAAAGDVQAVAVGAPTAIGVTAIVTAGANGVCETTAVGVDQQTVANGNGGPANVVVVRGLWTAPGGDDQVQWTGVTVVPNDVLTVTGVRDVAGNIIRPNAATMRANGTVH